MSKISIKSILKPFINPQISLKGFNLIDLICQKLLSGRAAKDWVNAKELDKVLLSLGLKENDAQDVALFMKKYFLEVNSKKKYVRLNPWALKIFNIP